MKREKKRGERTAPAKPGGAPGDLPASEPVVLPLDKLIEDPGNPRAGKVGAEDVIDLARSIAREGLLHPVAVNLVKGKKYVLIAGIRRAKACNTIGLTHIRAYVYCDLTPGQVATVRTVENLQRKDLTPIQEGEAFDRMRDLDIGLDVETIAARVGRSPSYVRRRIDLLRLCPQVRELVDSGRLPAAHANVVARVGDAKGQLKLAGHAIGAIAWGVPNKSAVARAVKNDYVMPVAELYKRLQTHLRTLGNKGWPMKERYAGGPPCAGCPNNTATEPGLFERVGVPGKSKKGNCTDAACFAKKLKAWQRELAKRPKAGKKGKEPKAIKAPTAKARPFPAGADEQHRLDLWRWGRDLRTILREAIPGDCAGRPDEAAGIVVGLCRAKSMCDVGDGDFNGKDMAKFAKSLGGTAPMPLLVGQVLDLFEAATDRFDECDEPLHAYQLPRKGEVALIDCLAALAKRWKLAVPERPKKAEPKKAKKSKPRTRPKGMRH